MPFQRLCAALSAAVLLLAGCAAAPGVVAGLPGSGGVPVASFAPLAKQVIPAVVSIAVIEGPGASVSPEVRALSERLRRPVRGAGSGFIVDPTGVIVTNTHVVGTASRITVTLSDGQELPGQVIGSDPLTDIAVIRVAARAPLPYVSWGDSRSVEVGDWILAAGNPFGVGTSVTAGIVSARGREIGAGVFDDFLQIDAPINPGNSGGPTFDLHGQVIAVNTAIVSPTGGSVGIGFAIPSEIAERVVDGLRRTGRVERGWLGVSIQPGRAREGVAIASVNQASPAANAGLRPGDVIVAVNGVRVVTGTGLIRAIAGTAPGEMAQLSVRRGDQNFELPVSVGRRPAEAER